MPLDTQTRASLEPQFGHDFGNVRIHVDDRAAESAAAVQAHAYTVGSHIVFSAGEYAPDAPVGRLLLAHELWHTIEQSAAGVEPFVQRAGIGEWWAENVSKPYEEKKEAAYAWMIEKVRANQKAAFEDLRARARQLPGMAQSTALAAIDVYEGVVDISTSLVYAIIGVVVGFVEGVVDIIKGLVTFLYTVVDLCVRFLYGFIDGGQAFDERANEIIDGLKKLPQGLKRLFDLWLVKFTRASPERQTIMIGELIGQLLAFIASFGLGAAKAGQIPGAVLPTVVWTGDRLAVAAVVVDVASPAAAGVMTGTSVMMAGGAGKGGPTPFPRKTLRGVSENWLKRNKPRGWREVPAESGGGWKWLDENGVERLRFMRPSGLNPSASKWARMANGYMRWQNELGEFLDIDGNVVDRASPQFDELTHIMYEGPP